MKRLDKGAVLKRFNEISEIWSSEDKWHLYTAKSISNFIEKKTKKYINNNGEILNAGSGGNSYGLDNNRVIHLDTCEKNIKHFPRYIIGDVENIPLKDNSIDFCLCVGNVINYADHVQTLNEFERIIKPNGFLILEFEKSNSFEYLFKNSFSKCATIVTTFYNGSKNEKIWVYSEKHIFNLIENCSFNIIKIKRFHIFSALIYRITKNDMLSAHFVMLDKIFQYIPFFRKISSNVIAVCQKNS